MIGPPTNSASANCQPMSTSSTMPSSSTRLVEANMKTIAVVKSAPFWNNDFAIAVAAYEQLDDTMPKPGRARDRGRPVVAHDPLHPPLRDERLHGTRQREAEDERPQRLPEHEERLAEAVADVGQRHEPDHDRFTTSRAVRSPPTPPRSSRRRAAPPSADRVGDAVREVLVEQFERDRLQAPWSRRRSASARRCSTRPRRPCAARRAPGPRSRRSRCCTVRLLVRVSGHA